jgi:membrane-associated phospholipid phosphatase
MLQDQARIWTYPARFVTGEKWMATTAVLGGTAGLIAVDPTEGAYFRRTSTFQPYNNVFTSQATLAGILATPAAFYIAGRLRHDSKMTSTALLAAEALADSEFVTTIIKDATRRLRPIAVSDGNFHDTWFESPGSLLRGRGSFPSGHTIGAMSVATVISRRYGTRHRWVPYVAYGMTALIGFSRMTLSSHFVSDVFLGGAMGYAIGRFTVLRQ